MTKDIFTSASGDRATVLNAISSYTIDVMAEYGKTNWQRAPQSPVVINPYFTIHRTNIPSSSVCLQPVAKSLRNTFLHEARHAYQASRAAVAGNDHDGDFLVNSIPIAPTGISADTTASRTVCNQSTDTTLALAYHGDSVFDQPGAPDYASYAWEMDAWTFAGMHDH